MITLQQKGEYRIIETKAQTKLLILDKKDKYAWINAADIGEILVTTAKSHTTDAILAAGKYRIYKVIDEPKYTDLLHLELLVGEGIWQGYLLTTGLPKDKKKRARIIPTREIITKVMN